MDGYWAKTAIGLTILHKIRYKNNYKQYEKDLEHTAWLSQLIPIHNRTGISVGYVFWVPNMSHIIQKMQLLSNTYHDVSYFPRSTRRDVAMLVLTASPHIEILLFP